MNFPTFQMEIRPPRCPECGGPPPHFSVWYDVPLDDRQVTFPHCGRTQVVAYLSLLQ